MDRGWTEGRTEGWRVAELLDPSRIPAGAETWFGKQVLFFVCVCACRIDPYGFERPEDFDYAAYEEFFSTYLVILTKRAIKWSKLLKGSGGVRKSLTGERPGDGWLSSQSTKRDFPQPPGPLGCDPERDLWTAGPPLELLCSS